MINLTNFLKKITLWYASNLMRVFYALSLPTYFKTNSKILLISMIICSTFSYTLTTKLIYIVSDFTYFNEVLYTIVIAGIINLFLLKFNCIIKIYSMIFKGVPFYIHMKKVTQPRPEPLVQPAGAGVKFIFKNNKFTRQNPISRTDLRIIMLIYFLFNLLTLLISVFIIVRLTHSLEEFNVIVGEYSSAYSNLISIISAIFYINNIFNSKYILESNPKFYKTLMICIMFFYSLFLILSFNHFYKTISFETIDKKWSDGSFSSFPPIYKSSILDLSNFEDLIKISGRRYIRKTLSIFDTLTKIDYNQDKSKFDFYRNVWYSEITPELREKYLKLNRERCKALFMQTRFSPGHVESGLVPHFTHNKLKFNLDIYSFWDNYKFLIDLHNNCLINKYQLKYSVIRLMYTASKQHVDNQFYYEQISYLLKDVPIEKLYLMPIEYFNYPIYMNGYYSICCFVNGMDYPIYHNLTDQLNVYEVLDFINKEKIKTQEIIDKYKKGSYYYAGPIHLISYLESLEETKNNMGNTRYIQYFNESYVGDQISLFSDKDVQDYTLDANKLLNRLHFDSYYNFFVFKYRNYFSNLIEVKPVPANNIFQVLMFSWDSRHKLLNDFSEVINYNNNIFIKEGVSKLNIKDDNKLYLSSVVKLYNYLVNLPPNMYSRKLDFAIKIVKETLEEYSMLLKLDRAIKIYDCSDLKRDANGLIYRESWANLLGGHKDNLVYPDSVDFSLFPPIYADDKENLVVIKTE